MSIEINGKIYRNLQEQVEKNKEDIEALQEQEPGETYTAGSGIDITENVISVDNTVALKTDIPSLTNYVTLDGNQTITGVKTFGEVHVTDAYGNCDINSYKISLNKDSRELSVYLGNENASFINYKNGITTNNMYSFPHQDATGTNSYTLATTSDIPSTTNFVTLDGTQTITGTKTFSDSIVIGNSSLGASIGPLGTGFYENSGNTTYDFGMNLLTNEAKLHYFKTVTGDSSSSVANSYVLPHTDVTGTNNYTLATTADIPTLSGLVMYNYKITIGGLDSGTSTARSAAYIISLPYQWDYSSLTKYNIIRLVPVYSIVTDTATSSNKGVGVFSWQSGTMAQIRWVDGTYTLMDFTGSFDATVEAAQPAHW